LNLLFPFSHDFIIVIDTHLNCKLFIDLWILNDGWGCSLIKIWIYLSFVIKVKKAAGMYYLCLFFLSFSSLWSLSFSNGKVRLRNLLACLLFLFFNLFMWNFIRTEFHWFIYLYYIKYFQNNLINNKNLPLFFTI
jgi:hypothetical protein